MEDYHGGGNDERGEQGARVDEPGRRGSPGHGLSGENPCPECGCGGKKEAEERANCGGTGNVTEPIGET